MSQTKTDIDRIIGYPFPPLTYTYTERDVCLYALGVGASSDLLDQAELQFVYERMSDTRIVFRCKAAERNEYVLTQAAAELSL